VGQLQADTAAPRTSLRGVHRRALGLLFAVLAAGLGLIAVFSALEGGGAWVIALAAAALAVWIGDLARRALRRPRL
jgi:predicted lipid-binding transport protein (Tim44 family)